MHNGGQEKIKMGFRYVVARASIYRLHLRSTERMSKGSESKPLPLAGRRFGALVALSRQGSHRRYAVWLCACDCGQQVAVPSDRLVSGRKRACGINGHKFRPPRLPTLRNMHIREHRSWCGMHDRCNDKSNKDYGGRGVTVCARWASFETFLKDMGPKPSSWHTLERKNVNGHYTPKNCVWIKRSQQPRNRRDTVYVRYNRKKLRLVDLVEQLGLQRSVVYGRLKMGWSLEDALSVPKRAHKGRANTALDSP